MLKCASPFQKGKDQSRSDQLFILCIIYETRNIPNMNNDQCKVTSHDILDFCEYSSPLRSHKIIDTDSIFLLNGKIWLCRFVSLK